MSEIQTMLEDPGHNREAALRRQRALVASELGRLGATARALDNALAALAAGTDQEVSTMFEDFDPSEYEDEARERWGHTGAYRESARRTASYGEPEWEQIRDEADQQVSDLAAAMAAGEPPDGGRARAIAERHRRHITQWFYPVSPAMHRNLADMYVADPRLAARYDSVAPGLAAYVRSVILANADEQERALSTD